MARILASWEADFEAARGDIPVSVWRRERRRHSAGLESGTRLGHGWRRSDSDERFLSFVSRFSVVSVRQAARFFYDGKLNTARQRVQKMIEAGLLERERTLTWAGPVVWPTLDGQRVALGAGHPLVGSFRPPESQMLHRLLVAERAAELMADGVECFSEREIRLFEQRGPEEFGEWLEDRGVKRTSADQLSPGVLPTVYEEEAGGMMMRRERWLACPSSSVMNKTLRYPDVVAVTDTGELAAIEVELAAKETPRLEAIIEGYRDAGPFMKRVPKHGEDGSVREVDKLARRQFRYIDWFGSPPVLRALRGHFQSVHPQTGRPSPGLIRDVYGRGRSDVTGRTDTIYTQVVKDDEGRRFRRDVEWDSTGVIPGRPMSAQPIPLPDDYGIAWRLQQQCLPDSYRFNFAEWEHWSNLWRKDLQTVGRSESDVSFTEWLAVGDNLSRCKSLTR